MHQATPENHLRRPVIAPIAVALLMAVTLGLIFFYAPTEATMGDVQRIMYLHIAVAWCGLAGCVAMGVCGCLYLVRRDLGWDHWLQAAGEVGWLCSTLTLVTGSLWAHEAWNTWWTWEPRLTASLILWMIYAGIFVVRSGIDDAAQRARIAAVLAILGTADVPIVILATRLFRGMHPATPEIDPRMRLVLLVSIVSFTALFACLAWRRRRQVALAESLAHRQALAEQG
jgi:heme exporter protein C